ncbi:PTS system, lactose/cellobiose family IIC component [Helcococcus kunzii ATCC 51366]|uniref:Permease IIC component n=1 Tax=Helcococcus kunzii ATCC 51366 TaxID=883114 RepID=H3NL90_9FIRM|nr:PTS transporter subunit EIIC [Helcococcus kunzii]EHR36071.1 PTS system, lactose/cellobiose family IIC component [Helcococcus kunzii ATCC 51366]
MNFVEKFTEKGQMIAGKLQANRYMKSISEGLMSLLPIMMIGAFSVLLSAMQWETYQNLIAPIKAYIALPAKFTNDALALYAVFSISYRLAKTFDIDGLVPGFIGLFSFLVVTPITEFAVEGSEMPVGALTFDWLGAKGLFAAMIIGLLSTRLYVLFVKRNWTIKMPDGVPPTISRTFSGLIPAIMVGIIFTIVSAIFSKTSFGSVHQFVYTLIQTPLQNLGGSIWSITIALFLMQLLWVFGIHGGIVILAIIRPIITALDLENLAAYQAGQPMPNLVSGGLWSTYANFSPMIGLVIVLLFMSKSKQFKTIGKLGAPGSLFGIHEPLIFGLPIVMNPILAIPYILAPIVCLLLGYFLTVIGILPIPIGMQVPFGAPIFVSGLLQGSWKLGVAQILMIFVTTALYYPFVKILDKRNVKAEQMNN